MYLSKSGFYTILIPKRFTVDEYQQLAELGFLKASDRIELINGEIICMAAKGVAHEVCITRLCRELPKYIGNVITIRCQSPIEVNPFSEPEPNFAFVRNRTDDYISGHPKPEDISLVIEVLDSSIGYDQTAKLWLYAENNIADY